MLGVYDEGEIVDKWKKVGIIKKGASQTITRRVRDVTRRGLEQWYSENRMNVLYEFAGRYGTSTEMVADALQDIMLHLLAKPDRYKRILKGHVEGFIYVAVSNRLKKMFTREMRRKIVEGTYATWDD